MENHGRTFFLLNEQERFKEKAGNLFGALDDVNYTPTEEEDGFLKTDPMEDIVQRGSLKRHHRDVGKAVGDEHVKTPAMRVRGSGRSLMPPPQIASTKNRRKQMRPGYLRNPSSYTKYSLDDVPPEQLSQKCNSSTALAFLRELDERQNKDEIEAGEPGTSRVIFKKPVHKLNTQKGKKSLLLSTGEDPEHVDSLGQVSPEHKPRKESIISLSHLEYEGEE